MFLYIVVSYQPVLCKKATVLINGIYNNYEEADKIQTEICKGKIPTNLGNNSMYGKNGRISWIKKVKLGELNNIDIYSPDNIEST